MTPGRRLVLSPRAVVDLEDIALFIARHNPARALGFVDELERKCRMAADNPLLYPSRPDLGPDIRMLTHGRYLILYRDLPDNNTVRVERVVHGARNPSRMI